MSPVVHGGLSCHLVPCSKLGGPCFLWEEISFTLASVPRITQTAAVGGPCSVGRAKTSCSFVLPPRTHGPLGKVCFLPVGECRHKHQYAVEFQAEKNPASCTDFQRTHTSGGVREETLVTYLLPSYLPRLSCCCMNIVHPETGRLWELLLNSISFSSTWTCAELFLIILLCTTCTPASFCLS